MMRRYTHAEARERFTKALELQEQGLSYAQIAERLGKRENSIGWMIKRAKELRLREQDLSKRQRLSAPA